MKIICTDNYARETISERVVAENVNSYYADLIVQLLNDRAGEHSQDFYVAQPDDYKPYVFQP